MDNKFTEEEINRQQAEIERLKQERDIYFKLAFSQENKPTAAELAAEAEREHFRDEYIRRLKEKIERLQKLLDDKCDRCIVKERAEAVKEFANKLETELAYFEEYFIEVQDWSARNTICQIINIVREMVGEG